MPLSSIVGAQSVVKPGVCTSTNRPASPFDGQVIYETDTDRIVVWDGSSWVYKTHTVYPRPGSVLNLASATKSDTQTTTSTTFVDITGLSVSITPSSASSKIYISAQVTAAARINVTQGYLQIVRNSTPIGVGDASGSRVQATAPITFSNAYHALSSSLGFLDNPNTTSSITYKIQIRCENGQGIYVNRSENDVNSAAGGRYISTITVMEIAG